MSNREDRYRTTSWDGRQVQRQQQAASAGQAPRSQQTARSSGGSQQGTGKKKAKKRSSMNPLLGILLWVVIVVSSSAIFAGVGWMLANDLCAFNKGYIEATVNISEDWFTEKTVKQDNGETETILIADMSKVADELEDQGLIEYKWFFRLFSTFYKSNKKIMPGTYTLTTEMDYMALVRGMRNTGSAETVDVTIPEGYSVQQIIDLLAEKGVGSVEDLTEAAESATFEYPFIDNENLGSISRLEGYLYPDTYNFYVRGDVTLAFNSMLSNFNTKIYENEDLSALFEASNYSFEEVITIASLIEKETDGADRENIASVIYNRLENAGETAHFLQIDAALVYAAGRPITQADYETLDSPYNLYQHTGLPPTPIANPGLASIKAALQPADTDYYYYVLGADGKHVFSRTLKEHEKAKAAAAAAAN